MRPDARLRSAALARVSSCISSTEGADRCRQGLSETLCLRVAGLGLQVDAQGSGLRLTVLDRHLRFLADESEASLTLRVRDAPPPSTQDWQSVFCSETWQLSRDAAGRYLFIAKWRSLPTRHILIDPGFAAGEVVAQFGSFVQNRRAVYPLEDIDIMLFANWLACRGDVILHASAIERDGAVYCFAGRSGAGKSTMADAFAGQPGCTLLGEDNLVLRCLDGRFWVFGTPWHMNAARCSPRGAPLERLYFLDRAKGHGLWPCTQTEGLAQLMQTAFIPYYRPEAVTHILDNLALLAQRVPFFTLGYKLGADPMGLIQHD